jgi:hypothetical protein
MSGRPLRHRSVAERPVVSEPGRSLTSPTPATTSAMTEGEKAGYRGTGVRHALDSVRRSACVQEA